MKTETKPEVAKSGVKDNVGMTRTKSQKAYRAALLKLAGLNTEVPSKKSESNQVVEMFKQVKTVESNKIIELITQCSLPTSILRLIQYSYTTGLAVSKKLHEQQLSGTTKSAGDKLSSQSKNLMDLQVHAFEKARTVDRCTSMIFETIEKKLMAMTLKGPKTTALNFDDFVECVKHQKKDMLRRYMIFTGSLIDAGASNEEIVQYIKAFDPEKK